jgi:hypothetical protein
MRARHSQYNTRSAYKLFTTAFNKPTTVLLEQRECCSHTRHIQSLKRLATKHISRTASTYTLSTDWFSTGKYITEMSFLSICLPTCSMGTRVCCRQRCAGCDYVGGNCYRLNLLCSQKPSATAGDILSCRASQNHKADN